MIKDIFEQVGVGRAIYIEIEEGRISDLWRPALLFSRSDPQELRKMWKSSCGPTLRICKAD